MITKEQKKRLVDLIDYYGSDDSSYEIDFYDVQAILAALDTIAELESRASVPVAWLTISKLTGRIDIWHPEDPKLPEDVYDTTPLYAAPPAARELSDEEERAAFEKNAEKRGYPLLRYVDADGVEQYEDEDTHRIWLTWQARAVLAVSPTQDKGKLSDTKILDWLEKQSVAVNEPRRYGHGKLLISAFIDLEEDTNGLRNKVRAVLAKGGS